MPAIALKLGILLVFPSVANPIAILSFVQLYVVSPSVFKVPNTIVSVDSLLHNTWSSISLTWAVGFTVMVIVNVSPKQSSADLGVTV